MEEKSLIINENKTPFSVFEQRIDYSLVKDPKKHRRNKMKKLLSRVAIGFCSLLLLVGGVIGIYEAKRINDSKKCPFKVGTYYYEEETGNYDSGIFDEDSYILISEEKLEEDASFEITNKNKDWIIYGQFKNSDMNNTSHILLIYGEELSMNNYSIKVVSDINGDFIVELNSFKGYETVKFTLRTE